MTDSQKHSWWERFVYVCSAGAFLLLVTSPVVTELMTNIPLVLFLLFAGLRYGGKETWAKTVADRKIRLLVAIYGILNCWSFYLVLFLLFAGQRYGGKEIWAKTVADRKIRLLLAIYGILNCWSFYHMWIFSSKAAWVAERLCISHRLLVLLTAVGLMLLSAPFVLRTVGLFLHAAKEEPHPGNRVHPSGCGQHKILPVCFLVALGTITFCSKSSFLYPMNDWVDVNCFFTVGKSMMNGIVPYRDLFEQKGPFLYFLHGLAWLISNDSFLGVYVLEVIAATFFLYYIHRSVSLFVTERTALLVIPTAALVIYTSPAFCHGDSVEELCMPFLAYAVWVGFKALLADSDIPDREYLIIGICSGLVFWSKFILVGFYIGWFLVPAVRLLKKQAYKKLFRAIGMVAVGVAVSTIPFVIYFGLHNAIGDWLEVYLYDNLFIYSRLEGEHSGFLKNMELGRLMLSRDNQLTYILCIFGMLWFYLKNEDSPWKKMLTAILLTCLLAGPGTHSYLFAFIYLYWSKVSKTALYMTSMLLFTFFFTYIGGQTSAYYAFVFSVFVPFGVMAAIDQLSAAIPELEKLLKNKMVPVVCIVLSIAASLWLTPNRYLMGMNREDLPQYQFARIIHQVESPTLLNYGFLDGGFYTAAELLPNCKAFCKLNIPLEEMIQLQEEYVREGLCDFVVTREKELEYDHYTLVAKREFIFEESMREYYLYQLK